MSETFRCPNCASAVDINLLFEVRPEEIYMVLEGELVGITDLACRLFCQQCAWRQTGVLHNAVVDLATYKITSGEFIPNS